NFIRDRFTERRSKSRRCFAHPGGFGDAREERAPGFDATLLRQAARDPVNVLKACKRGRGGFRIGGLGIVDEEDVSLAPDLLHPVGKARESAEAFGDFRKAQPTGKTSSKRSQCVLCVVATTERADAC